MSLPVRILTKEDSTELPRAYASEDSDGRKPMTGYLCHQCHGELQPVRCATCCGCGLIWRRGHDDPNGENVYGDDA